MRESESPPSVSDVSLLSRNSSTNSAADLGRTIDALNLNKVPARLPRHITAYHPYGPPPAVAWLVGTWKGKGRGMFPTIRDFAYDEECT